MMPTRQNKGAIMLKIGDKMPDFELPNQDNQIVHVSDFRGKKIVLFSFPMAGTAECTRQACIYRDTYSDFSKYNAIVLGISSSSIEALRTWRVKHGFPYILLSDTRHVVLEMLGVWGQKIAGSFVLPLAQRAYWVVNETGIIDDMQIGVRAEESVELSLNFVEKSQSANNS
jgi:thioredoxin-dependent peroxiredoxin